MGAGLHTQHGGWYTREQTPEEKAKAKAEARRAYIRQHAPTILAGLLADPDVHDVDSARDKAVEAAGRIFDETEVPTDG